MLSFDGQVFRMIVREELNTRIIEESVIDVPQYVSVFLSNVCQMVQTIHLHRR